MPEFILTQRMAHTEDKPPAQRKGHKMEVEGLSGKETATVYFVSNGDVEPQGAFGYEGENLGIFIRRTTSPALVPLLVQMHHSISLGFTEPQAIHAMLFFARERLRTDDLEELHAIVGMKETSLVKATREEGDPEYYFESLKGYIKNYRKHRYVATARKAYRLGDEESALMYAAAIQVADKIMNEGPIERRKADGKMELLSPALKTELPTIVGSLEKLADALEKKFETMEKKAGIKPRMVVPINNLVMSRVLSCFAEVPRSPIRMIKDEPGEPTVFEFGCRSPARIRSAVNHLRTTLVNEEEVAALVLEAAKRMFGELSGGDKYRALLAGKTADGKEFSQDEIKQGIREMERLGSMRDFAKRSIVGARPGPAKEELSGAIVRAPRQRER